MIIEEKEAVVTILNTYADIVRALSNKLELRFAEEQCRDDSKCVKFRYVMNDVALSKLVSQIPLEAYFFKGQFK